MSSLPLGSLKWEYLVVAVSHLAYVVEEELKFIDRHKTLGVKNCGRGAVFQFG